MNPPKFIFFIILLFSLQGVKSFAQTAKTVSTPKRYNVLVKYNIELIAMGNIYRERELKTNGVNRSGDEHLQHWGNTKTLFSTQGALIANNFELYKDTETGIISISSTDDTKVSTRKKDGVPITVVNQDLTVNFKLK